MRPGKRLGVVVFGHSGAAELGDDLRKFVPEGQIFEQGLLDDVSERSLQDWRTGPDSTDGTVIHLRDGRELTIESAPLMERIAPALERLAAMEPQVVLYGCAGPVPEYAVPGQALSLRPMQLMQAFLAATVPQGKVGMIVPSPLHIEPAKRNYGGQERSVDCRAVSPADRESVLATAASLRDDGADVVMLGCFDHTLRDLRAARSVVDCQVLSSRQLALVAARALLRIDPA